MERFVSMPSFPPNLKFPREFVGRIKYDADRKRLVYHGFMSKADFDRLNRLSDDWSYKRQLEELFRLCGPEEPRKPLLARAFSLLGL